MYVCIYGSDGEQKRREVCQAHLRVSISVVYGIPPPPLVVSLPFFFVPLLPSGRSCGMCEDCVTYKEAGYLPDMVTFTLNGEYILTADEGEPVSDHFSGGLPRRNSSC